MCNKFCQRTRRERESNIAVNVLQPPHDRGETHSRSNTHNCNMKLNVKIIRREEKKDCARRSNDGRYRPRARIVHP